MVEYTTGIMRDGGRPRHYLRIKSDNPIYAPDPVVIFTREQSDKRSIYECIIGDLIRTAREEGFYYEWYELESVLVETDHTPPLAAGLEELAPNVAAAAIAFVTLAEAGQIDNVTAVEHAGQFETWAKDVDYKTGAIRVYDGVLYRCIQSHTSQTGWEPPEVSSLWIKIADPSDEWPEWGQPVGAHDSYGIGDKAAHNGWKWVSTAASNVWEPGVYGWELYIRRKNSMGVYKNSLRRIHDVKESISKGVFLGTDFPGCGTGRCYVCGLYFRHGQRVDYGRIVFPRGHYGNY